MDHLWKHRTFGTVYNLGLNLITNVSPSTSGLPTAPPNVDGRNTVVSVTSGSTLDENLQVNIANNTSGARFSQDLGNVSAGSLTLSNSALFKMSYTDAGSVLKMLTATRFPFSFNASTNIPEYITTTGVRTSVTNKSWIVNYIYSFGDPRPGEVVKVRSSNVEYASFVNAQAAKWDDLRALFPTLQDQEIRTLYKMIHYVEHTGGGAYSALVKYAALVQTVDIRGQSAVQIAASSGTVLASNVSTAPTATLLATNAQAALAELDTKKLAVSGGTVSGILAISGAAGTVRPLDFSTAGSVRWEVAASATAETGSNAGSNFAIKAYNDSGSLIDQPVSIGRVAGSNIAFARNVVLQAASTSLQSIVIPHGAAPSTPTDGSTWTTTAGLFIRINGVTKTATLT